jgi:hypothetical protein
MNTKFIAKLKDKEYFMNHTDFNKDDILLFDKLFNTNVTITHVNPITGFVLIKETFGTRWLPEDFVK